MAEWRWYFDGWSRAALIRRLVLVSLFALAALAVALWAALDWDAFRDTLGRRAEVVAITAAPAFVAATVAATRIWRVLRDHERQ